MKHHHMAIDFAKGGLLKCNEWDPDCTHLPYFLFNIKHNGIHIYNFFSKDWAAHEDSESRARLYNWINCYIYLCQIDFTHQIMHTNEGNIPVFPSESLMI